MGFYPYGKIFFGKNELIFVASDGKNGVNGLKGQTFSLFTFFWGDFINEKFL
jgi:hypothetical protein